MKRDYIFSVLFVALFGVTQLALGDGIQPTSSYTDFSSMFMNIVTQVLQIIGTLATIMFIVSGIIYIFSFGNPQAMTTGKNSLFYAIIGIVVGISATAIVAWIKSVVGS